MDVDAPVRLEKTVPVALIERSLESLTETQKRAFKRNVPWILHSMQQRFMNALEQEQGTHQGKITDAKIAEVVKEVVRNFCKLTPAQLADLPVDGSGQEDIL